MAEPAVDISMAGDKELIRKLSRLADKVQRRVVVKELGKSRTRLKRAIVAKVARPGFFNEPTGELLATVKGLKFLSRTTRDLIVRGISQPETKEEAIKFNSVEYGHVQANGGFVPEKSFVRSTVDENAEFELRVIGTGIGIGIEREAAK